MQTYEFKLCGLDVTFKSSTDSSRVEKAVDFIREKYDNLQLHGSQLGRDKLLAILAIGLADDLLELQKKHNSITQHVDIKEQNEKETNERLQRLVSMLNSLDSSL